MALTSSHGVVGDVPRLPSVAASGDESNIQPLDGRRARRQRNRDALVEAWLDTVADGDLEPSIATVAERSGISYRSVFRYFENINELFVVAADRYRARRSHLATIADIGAGAFDDRVDRFVEHRITYYDAMGPLATAARMRAPVREDIRDQLDEVRSGLRQQMDKHFAGELGRLSAREAVSVRSAIDTLCSQEAYDMMRTSQGLTREQSADVMGQTIRRLLLPAGD